MNLIFKGHKSGTIQMGALDYKGLKSKTINNNKLDMCAMLKVSDFTNINNRIAQWQSWP